MTTPRELWHILADSWTSGHISGPELLNRYNILKDVCGRDLTGDDLKTKPEAICELLAQLNTSRYSQE